MTIAEEKADAYLRENAVEEYNLGLKWEVKTAYIAGYQDAERYRVMLMAAVRNATHQPPDLTPET